MAFLVELGQVALALFVSGAVAVLVGPTYAAVAVLVAATCGVLLLDSERQRSAVTGDTIDAGTILSLVGTSIVFGLIWPAIPLVLTWKRLGAAPAVDDE